MRGTVKSELVWFVFVFVLLCFFFFFLKGEITSVLFQGTKMAINTRVTTGKYFELSVLIHVHIEKMAQKPLYWEAKKGEKTYPASCPLLLLL